MELLLNVPALAPSAWVQRWSSLIRHHGRVLDLACGSGRHAVWLAKQGFSVTAVDRDPEAIASLQRLALPNLQAEPMDLEGDGWPLEGRAFDAVVVTNYLWRPKWSNLMALLADGGVLIYETFSIDHATIGRPSRGEFLLQRLELINLCSDCHVVAFEDGFDPQGPRFVQRIAAVRPENSHLDSIPRYALSD